MTGIGVDLNHDDACTWREVAYNVALVKRDAGRTLLPNVVATDLDALKPGQAVQPVFLPISDEYAILRFTAAADALPGT